VLAVAETEAILRRAASRRVVVVGDLILDEYFWGEIERISAEAPVPVLQLRRAEHVLGGAANVARNLASLGALVSAAGVVERTRRQRRCSTRSTRRGSIGERLFRSGPANHAQMPG